MCNKCSHIDNIVFKRNGTNQTDRIKESLNPDNLELHDFSIEDWMLFAFHFAEKVKYFSIDEVNQPEGNWQSFFNLFEEMSIPQKRTSIQYDRLKSSISELLLSYKENGELTPHLTLFVCFLQLLEFAKKRFNKITKRHLLFFYEDILKIEKLPAKEDKVYVLFELAKKVSEFKIDKNTLLEANKDANGIKLNYTTDKDFVVNKASVVSLKSVYNYFKEVDESKENSKLRKGELKYSEVANSLDGMGEELTENLPFWYPFGYPSLLEDSKNKDKQAEGEKGADKDNYKELPDAKIGFSIAAPILALKDGIRNVSITINFKEELFPNDINNKFSNNLLKWFNVYYSSSRGWQKTNLSSKNIPIFIKNLKFNEDGTPVGGVKTIAKNKKIQLVFSLDKDMPALENYKEETFKAGLHTDLPVVRFELDFERSTIQGISVDNELSIGDNNIDESTTEIHSFFRKLVNRKNAAIESIVIKTAVFDIETASFESDLGLLNAKKPFMPFTSNPIKESAFTIDYPEVFSKKWKNINIEAKWMDAPVNFDKYYAGYPIEYPTDDASKPKVLSFTANTKLLYKGKWHEKDKEINLFNNYSNTSRDFVYSRDQFQKQKARKDDDDIVKLNTYIVNNAQSEIDQKSKIRLTLNQSFYHKEFPKIYSQAFVKQAAQPDKTDIIIPNPAYTPLIETIKLAYCAQESVDFNSETHLESFEEQRIKLFHNDIFGAYQEHNFLKQKAIAKNIIEDTLSNKLCYLIPDYCYGGELYIGIKDITAKQQISLLIQVLEASENPNSPTFTGKQGVSWSVLCDNFWKDLGSDVLVNEIDNFLRSGIVTIKIPEQATITNTKFSEPLIWIRAKMHKNYDAVCKVFGVYAQAIRVAFNNNGNELSHLNNGLKANTIAKLVTRIPQIKKVEQPFSSFGGMPLESDQAYFRRVSERLRHKNRAINLWDYEHLILEKFPEVFRVKCLNHTSKESFMAPGNVLLLVIPDIVNKNVFDIYEPRLSTTLLDKIKSYINSINSKQVQVFVENPKYERVKVKVKVKFYPEFDENYYKFKLQEDIIKMLSPWAFNSTESIRFGVELQSSTVIHYIENLPYVDYITSLSLAKISEGQNSSNVKLNFQKKISPLSPKHILVSSKTHLIEDVENPCKKQIKSTPEECQH